MKVVAVKRVLGRGPLAPTPEWKSIRQSVETAVSAFDWPEGSGSFTIKSQKNANGVEPIQKRAANLLNEGGWKAQYPWPIDESSKPGRMDAAFESSYGTVAFEWETGNVSSSHRSINKICLGFYLGALAGGIVVLPSNRLARYLTDRVGNIGEIERYFPLWQNTPCTQGVLEIIVIEHDYESPDVDPIAKKNTGRAVRG